MSNTAKPSVRNSLGDVLARFQPADLHEKGFGSDPGLRSMERIFSTVLLPEEAPKRESETGKDGLKNVAAGIASI